MAVRAVANRPRPDRPWGSVRRVRVRQHHEAGRRAHGIGARRGSSVSSRGNRHSTSAGIAQQGERAAIKGGLISATAYSAIEQALWDLAGKALDVPTCTLFGGRVRDALPTYANVNRATRPRTPAGFAAAARMAVGDGFRAIKAAPFDGFPPPGSPASAIDAAVDAGIASMAAMRDAIGPDVELMVDCHSFFDVPLAVSVAKRLEPYRLAWYEEPVPPERTEETRDIRRLIQQPMAGGEILYGVAGFAPLSRNRTVDVIMPDVKHCGGLLELTRIAAVAETDGVTVAPHNPERSGLDSRQCSGLRRAEELPAARAAMGRGGVAAGRPESARAFRERRDSRARSPGFRSRAQREGRPRAFAVRCDRTMKP